MRLRTLALALFLVLPICAGGAPGSLKVADERIVLHTRLGDLVVALFPTVAPKHVAQLLALVRAGAYDGTEFCRVEPGFIVQTATAFERSPDRPLIHRIPAEFSSLHHVRGVLSMARAAGDPNSAESSFSILLGPAPHLDGKYTIFGTVERGEAVLQAIEHMPVDPKTHRPLQRLIIDRAEIVGAASLAQMKLKGAPLASNDRVVAPDVTGIDPRLVLMFAAVTAGLALAIAFGSRRLARSGVRSLALLIVLVAGFLAFSILSVSAQRSAARGIIAFFGLLGLLRLMSRFEEERTG